MRMNMALVHRPTSGASANELAAQLREVRLRTRSLTDDLSAEQLMGPMLPIVNPILWEIVFHLASCVTCTVTHPCSSEPIGYGTRAPSLMRHGGIWNCPIAPACSRT